MSDKERLAAINEIAMVTAMSYDDAARVLTLGERMYTELRAELDACRALTEQLRAERDALLPVVEAAKAWRDELVIPALVLTTAESVLAATVDAIATQEILR